MSFVSDLLFGPDEPPAPDYAGAAAVSGESAVEVAQIQQKTERDRLAWAKEKDVAQVALGERAILAQERGQEFQETQYNDWDAVFGDLQTNIGEYYKQLGPEKIESQGLQANQKAFQKQQISLAKQMQQRGIQQSGVEAAAMTQLAGTKAIADASIRAGAEEQSYAKKAGFLGIGLGQGAQMLGTVAQQQSNVGYAFGTAMQGSSQGGQLVSGAYSGLSSAQGQQSQGHFGAQQSYISGGASIFRAQSGAAASNYAANMGFAGSMMGGAEAPWVF